MGRYVVRPRAESDLHEIWRYSFQNWGKVQADRYIDRIRACVREIADDPRIGRPCRGRPGHFEALVGSHIVIYRVLDEGVGIVRILHQRMDPSRHM